MMCLKRCATWSSASLHATRSRLPLLTRIIGYSSRSSSPSVSPSADPFEHSRPRLAGCSGSAAIAAPPPPSGVASTPQPTPQYGQVVRVVRRVGSMAVTPPPPRPRERAAEHHIGADPRDRPLATDQFEIPQRIRGIADQHRAGEPAVRYHELL